MSDSLAVSYSRNATKTLYLNSSNVVASLHSCKVCNELKKHKSRTFRPGLIAGWHLKLIFTFVYFLLSSSKALSVGERWGPALSN